MQGTGQPEQYLGIGQTPLLEKVVAFRETSAPRPGKPLEKRSETVRVELLLSPEIAAAIWRGGG